MVPGALWKAMRAAPSIELRAEPGSRARYLAAAYIDLATDTERLAAAFARMPGRYGRAVSSAWLDLARQGAHEDLARSLIETHYDPAYARWSRNNPSARLGTIEMGDLSHERKMRAAETVATLMGDMERE